MDPISKLLSRLTDKERARLKEVMARIKAQNLKGLDVKKFEGFEDLYRIRVGAFRFHLRRTSSGIFYVINLDRRTTTTYRKKR